MSMKTEGSFTKLQQNKHTILFDHVYATYNALFWLARQWWEYTNPASMKMIRIKVSKTYMYDVSMIYIWIRGG